MQEMVLSLKDMPNIYIDLMIDYLRFYKNSLIINSLKEEITVNRLHFMKWTITATIHLEETFKWLKKKETYEDKIEGKTKQL